MTERLQWPAVSKQWNVLTVNCTLYIHYTQLLTPLPLPYSSIQMSALAFYESNCCSMYTVQPSSHDAACAYSSLSMYCMCDMCQQ